MRFHQLVRGLFRYRFLVDRVAALGQIRAIVGAALGAVFALLALVLRALLITLVLPSGGFTVRLRLVGRVFGCAREACLALAAGIGLVRIFGAIERLTRVGQLAWPIRLGRATGCVIVCLAC